MTAAKGSTKQVNVNAAPTVHIHTSANPLEVRRHVSEVLRQFERDQQGALSD